MSKMDIYTYSLLTALVILWFGLIFSLVWTSYRKKQSFFGGSVRLRAVIVVVLILAACFLIFCNVDSLRTGELMVAVSRKGIMGSRALKLHRAEDPEAFWIFFGIYSGMALTYLSVAVGEIVCSLRERKALKHAAAKRLRHKAVTHTPRCGENEK